ncbi:MAG TPA: tetratricopeptide repeat protein [Candidatus Acidoferrales bacterium]|nr:tetratricopeptide repeat protein [Candidatus Acidoferrales bacterium]
MFLSLCALLLIPMFTTTGVIVRLFHEKQASIAAAWEKAGNTNLQAGHAEVAIEDFRNSLLYSPDDSKLQLELAEALAAQGQTDEAENYLFTLRTADPESSMIDLQLARISAHRGDIDAAVAFYHDATFGQWPSNAHKNQLATWEELIQFLLNNSRKEQARAEALSLAADNPADPDVLDAAAGYLAKTGDNQNALSEYEAVLRLSPTDVDALAGAGNAALALFQLPEADRYFTRALQHGAKDGSIAGKRDLAAAASELDPFNTRISERERQARAIEIFQAAEQHAKACFPALVTGGDALPNNLKPLAAERAALPAKLTRADFSAHPEYVDQVLDWAFAVEQAIPPQCGGTLADRAIQYLAGRNKES